MLFLPATACALIVLIVLESKSCFCSSDGRYPSIHTNHTEKLNFMSWNNIMKGQQLTSCWHTADDFMLSVVTVVDLRQTELFCCLAFWNYDCYEFATAFALDMVQENCSKGTKLLNMPPRGVGYMKQLSQNLNNFCDFYCEKQLQNCDLPRSNTSKEQND